MTYEEAKTYVETHFPVNWDSASCALIELRHKAIMFPELGVNGVERDSAQWMYIDGEGKIDTGMYGEVYYF